jgi:hypothetical protein
MRAANPRLARLYACDVAAVQHNALSTFPDSAIPIKAIDVAWRYANSEAMDNLQPVARQQIWALYRRIGTTDYDNGRARRTRYMPWASCRRSGSVGQRNGACTVRAWPSIRSDMEGSTEHIAHRHLRLFGAEQRRA